MIPFLESLERSTETTSALMISHLWTSTLFLAIVLVFIVVARRRLTARMRYVLILIGLVKFAVPGNVVVMIANDVRSNVMPPDRGGFALPLQVAGGAFDFTESLGSRTSGLIILVWSVVAVCLFFKDILGRRRLVRRVLRAASSPEAREIGALERAKRRMRVRQHVDMIRTPTSEGPAVLRIIRPLIILPAQGCTSMSDDELESLLSHECAHVARHDNLLARIESLIGYAFWFHPLVWISRRLASRERERACDEAVAEAYEGAQTYLNALSRFCHAAVVPRMPGASRMATSNLKERLDHLAGYESLRSRAFPARSIMVPALLGLLGFTLASAMASNSGVNPDTAAKRTEPDSPRAMALETASGYNGRPITLSLKKANLRDVIATIADLTGTSVQVADDVDGTATVELVNVPWDQALDSIVRDHDIKSEIRRGTIYISKR